MKFDKYENEGMFKYLLMAVDIMEITVGVDHPDTAELYTKIGLAYKEAGILVN